MGDTSETSSSDHRLFGSIRVRLMLCSQPESDVSELHVAKEQIALFVSRGLRTNAQGNPRTKT
jgi:hypothetical protein